MGQAQEAVRDRKARSRLEGDAKPEDVWAEIRAAASNWCRTEPLLSALIQEQVMQTDGFDRALGRRLACAFSCKAMPQETLETLIGEVLAEFPEALDDACSDLLAIRNGDPAALDPVTPFLFFKSFAALGLHRIAHRLWWMHREPLALFLQQRCSLVAGIDIHPAARLGRGILMDHGTGIVIGETAVISDHVTMFHNVTLGGTGKERGDRHPKVGQGVFIGAGATLLGRISIGDWARIGAGSVVLADVPERSLAVGVPARTRAIDDDWRDAQRLAPRKQRPEMHSRETMPGVTNG